MREIIFIYGTIININTVSLAVLAFVRDRKSFSLFLVCLILMEVNSYWDFFRVFFFQETFGNKFCAEHTWHLDTLLQ